MAVGADQGGSIRNPSARCGIVGLKPTLGLVPYTGIFPMEFTLDHVGPMARTVYDVALLLEVCTMLQINTLCRIQFICMQNSFSYGRFRTSTRFETEAQENSEVAYSSVADSN